jgi:hypothetical protein
MKKILFALALVVLGIVGNVATSTPAAACEDATDSSNNPQPQDKAP